MPMPKTLVIRYFQLIVKRKFTEGLRELERINNKMQKTDWNRGYYQALYGMYLSQKNTNDEYSFFSKFDFSDTEVLNKYRREFLEHTRNGLHADYDRGYFSAWAGCMRVIIKMNISPPTLKKPKEEKPPIETVRSDKNQATMANFYPKKKNN
ncbi:MAG: hypothetical protein NWF10_06910 [Candidatus Bathyarchaeota archaeon]|nr:hypothetical protein [Candidatus Bathyarchaeota archaeon]